MSPAAPSVDRVLVAVGGEDRTGLTARLVRSVMSLDTAIAIEVVIGRRTDETEGLERDLQAAGRGSTLTVAAPSLAPHLARADLVLSGGGLTKYEAAYLGLPVAVINQTDDQSAETRSFARAGLAVDLGDASCDQHDLTDILRSLIEDEGWRHDLASRGRSTFPADPTLDAARSLLALVQD